MNETGVVVNETEAIASENQVETEIVAATAAVSLVEIETIEEIKSSWVNAAIGGTVALVVLYIVYQVSASTN